MPDKIKYFLMSSGVLLCTLATVLGEVAWFKCVRKTPEYTYIKVSDTCRMDGNTCLGQCTWKKANTGHECKSTTEQKVCEAIPSEGALSYLQTVTCSSVNCTCNTYVDGDPWQQVVDYPPFCRTKDPLIWPG